MNFIDSIILGVVEGLTEFIPVSSTGHLILSATLLGLKPTVFTTSFEIAIQIGAIAAVVVTYRDRFFKDAETWKRIGAAFLPTALVGLAVYKPLKKLLLHAEPVILASLFLGGVALIVFDRFYKAPPETEGEPERPIGYRQCALIGLMQCLAFIPGVSRSAATILGGLMLGVRRKTIVEFSFLLAVPTLAAATGLDLVKNAHSFSADQFLYLLAGASTAFVAAFFTLRFFLGIVEKRGFTLFGVYRIVAAALFWYFV